MSENEEFPNVNNNDTGKIERHVGYRANIVAYDYDGARYCVECAEQDNRIDREQFRNRPKEVAYGGAVREGAEADHEQYCGRCLIKIPEIVVIQ